MSRSRSYHHGQLRESLLDALLQLARDTPLAQISLREVARTAGVSHAAPYHHFESKEAMIEAATLECLRHLSQALSAAVAALPAETHPLDKIRALGKAYIQFALQRSTEYQFINRSDVCNFQNMTSEIRIASGEAVGHLHQLVVEAQQQGHVPDADPQTLVLALWSTVHGMAGLLLLGIVPPESQDGAIDAVMTVGLRRMLE